MISCEFGDTCKTKPKRMKQITSDFTCTQGYCKPNKIKLNYELKVLSFRPVFPDLHGP